MNTYYNSSRSAWANDPTNFAAQAEVEMVDSITLESDTATLLYNGWTWELCGADHIEDELLYDDDDYFAPHLPRTPEAERENAESVVAEMQSWVFDRDNVDYYARQRIETLGYLRHYGFDDLVDAVKNMGL